MFFHVSILNDVYVHAKDESSKWVVVTFSFKSISFLHGPPTLKVVCLKVFFFQGDDVKKIAAKLARHLRLPRRLTEALKATMSREYAKRSPAQA